MSIQIEIDWDSLTRMDADELAQLGLCRYGDMDLWLFPVEWFDWIPEGLMVTCIDGETLPFSRELLRERKRHGYLSFGIRNSKAEQQAQQKMRETNWWEKWEE